MLSDAPRLPDPANSHEPVAPTLKRESEAPEDSRGDVPPSAGRTADLSPADHRANRILGLAARLWFLVALPGQWMFAAYIVLYFGAKLVAGGLPALDETHLTGGYVAGDGLGNIVVGAHVLVAIVVHFGGPLQLVPRLRRQYPVVHRVIGRAFLATALVAGVSGLYLVWGRGTDEGWIADWTNTIGAMLIGLFGWFAVRAAIRRDLVRHRRWALRLFMVVSAVWFVRLGIYGSFQLANLVGIEFAPISKQVFAAMHVAKLVVPLTVLEVYLWAQDRAGPAGRLGAAALVFVATAFMALGIHAVTTMAWLPKALGQR